MATILVVDDEPDIRELVELHLVRDGHRVVTAADGARALAVLGREIPDLVLLDLAMPELDGWEVLSAMKGRGEGPVSRVPVVMLSAHHTTDDRIRGGIGGAVQHLPKPFHVDDLRRAVRAALGGAPEPVQRRRAQTAALEALARQERGAGSVSGDDGPRAVRPHLTRLEHRPEAPRVAPAAPVPDVDRRAALLTPKQRRLLQAVAASASVATAAAELGTSRSNVYAGLRRVARKLGVGSVPELLAMARAGDLPDGTAP